MNFTLALPTLKNLSFLLWLSCLSRSLALPRNEFLEAVPPLKNDQTQQQ